MYLRRSNIQLEYPLPRKLMEDSNFQQLLDCLNVGLFVCDSLFHRIHSFTSHLSKILQVDEVELKRNPSLWGEMMRSLEGGRVDEILVNALDREENGEFDLNILDFSGVTRRIRVTLLNCSSHRNHEILGQIRDITGLRRQEIAAAQVESLEAEYSARIQKKLLLGEPMNVPPGLSIGTISIPSQRVDGDFYDFNSTNHHIQDFFMGDVMGKGLNAALMGAGTKNLFNKSIIHLLTSTKNLPSPREIVDMVDSHISQDLIHFNSFITLSYGRINLDQGILELVDCGNTPLLHYSSRDDSCWLVSGSNMPLGFIDHQTFQAHHMPLDHNDILFLYSDGLTEANNAEGEPLGIDRLIHMVISCKDLAPKEMVSHIVDLCFQYSESGFSDDATAVALKMDRRPKQQIWSDFYPVDLGKAQYLETLNRCLEKWQEEAKAHLSREGIVFLLPQIAQWLQSLHQQNVTKKMDQHLIDVNKLEELMPMEQDSHALESGICWAWNDHGLSIELIYHGAPMEGKALKEHPFTSLNLLEGLHHFHKIIGYLELDQDQ